MKPFDFRGLFIYDLANNHQGDLEHGLNIIRALGEVTRTAGIRAAMKFQFRELETFIHPAHRDSKENKHIPRFLGTRLSNADYERMTHEVRAQGMITMSTPFDEASVDFIEKLDIEVIKIASCSAADRPLLRRVVDTNKPVVASTAGLDAAQIDYLVNFFEMHGTPFALMHCVALYPTPDDQLKLNQIQFLKARYPKVPIGFSTHEEPDHTVPVQIAFAKGAELFERHAGLETDKYKLNAYSSRPEQIARWIAAYQQADAICGGSQRCPSHPDEIGSLRSLKRGVYAKRPVKRGEPLQRDAVFFAMPLADSQMDSGAWSPNLVAERDYDTDAPIDREAVIHAPSHEQLIFQILLQVKGMLNKARIFVGPTSTLEISHHYGLERFREFGAVIVNCVNRAYCKKLIIQLPRQKHPYHYHKQKEETFHVLSGDLEIELDGRRTALHPGDIFLIQPNQWHKFHTLDGVIFEELSTTHYNNDSFYEDEQIARLPREKRKTVLPNWEAAAAKELG